MIDKELNIVGLMSGTSLDGLDICWVKFSSSYDFEIVKTQAIDYTVDFKKQLSEAHLLSGLDLMRLDNEFALFCANKVVDFLEDDRSKIDLLASHGHTVFHNPNQRLTTQIGSGAVLYANTGIKTVSDFRSVDVALGGQGAPLVPIGDLLLFKDQEACLNLGGIANVSIKQKNKIEAQDLCFANMLSNYICENQFDKPYDEKGLLGMKGQIDDKLVNEMINFHQSNNSLAREDFINFLNLIPSDANPYDLLRSAYEYSTSVIASFINDHKANETLVTGGGAHNDFFISLLRQKSKGKIIIPSSEIIDFKESLIFAFLGLLRINKTNNTLKIVTNAKHDNIGGAVYG